MLGISRVCLINPLPSMPSKLTFWILRAWVHVLFIGVCSAAFGQSGNFNSLASGNWNVSGTWTQTSGTDADGVPDSDDNVTILSTHTVTVGGGVTPTHDANSVTVNNGATLRFGSGALARTLTVTTNFIIGTTATVNINPASLQPHILIIGGNFTHNNGGTFTPTNGAGSLTVTFNGAGAQALNGTSPTQSFWEVNVAKGDRKSVV